MISYTLRYLNELFQPLELSRLQFDLSGRRSDRSHSSHSQSSVGPEELPETIPPPPPITVTKVNQALQPSTIPASKNVATNNANIPIRMTGNTTSGLPRRQQPPSTPRVVEEAEVERQVPATPPFPQIRGEHMERLFFSAPPHDQKTCHACHRRKSMPPHSAGTPQWLRKATRDLANGGSCPIELDQQHADGQDDHLPPQTAIVRVVKELEDDFAHYKAYVGNAADTPLL